MFNKLNVTTVLGKLITLIIIIMATQYNILAGLVVLLLVLIMNRSIIEGMENSNTDIDENKDTKLDETSSSKEGEEKIGEHDDTDTKKDTIDDISKFRTDYCKQDELMLNGKQITALTIKESFPNLKFKNDMCNPCDKDCQFEIISSNERITVEENIKPIDSNSEPVNHKEAIKKRE
mgnify:CR=1 FL=1|jgi:hypothetical protein